MDSPQSSDAQPDLLADFRSELQQLTATQRELIHEFRSDGVIDFDAEELERLRQENAELRSQVEELERQLHARANGAHVADGADAPVGDEEELKQDLAEQRRQLEEDEASLMQQMRSMEMALAKDRADLARQRNELERQQADFAHEMEKASRDPELCSRLASLRPRQQDNQLRPPAEYAPAAAPIAAFKNSGLIRRLFG